MCHWLRGPVAFCAGVAGRTDQAGGQHFQLTPCSASTATATACWRPLLPTGSTSNCRSRRRSSRRCGRSAVYQAGSRASPPWGGPGRACTKPSRPMRLHTQASLSLHRLLSARGCWACLPANAVTPLLRLPGGLVHSDPVSHELPTEPGSVVFIPAKSKPGMMPSP